MKTPLASARTIRHYYEMLDKNGIGEDRFSFSGFIQRLKEGYGITDISREQNVSTDRFHRIVTRKGIHMSELYKILSEHPDIKNEADLDRYLKK